MRILVKDSRGKPSWTITFCIVVIVFTLPVFTAWVFDFNIAHNGSFTVVCDLLQSMWYMTIGAFIAREVTEKIKDKIGGKKK